MPARVDNSKITKSYTILVSLILIAAGFLGAIYTGEGLGIFSDILKYMLSPSKSSTDYFGFGSLGAAYLNAGLCGLGVMIPVILMKAEAGASIMTAYFLVIAHGFYGKNLLNIWPCILGTYLCLKLRGLDVEKHLHVCSFSSCFAPLISEVLFRYTLDEFTPGDPQVSLKALGLTLLCSLAVGFIFPFLLTFMGGLTKGYNLYNAGLAGGVLGTAIFVILYLIPGRELQSAMEVSNEVYLGTGKSFIAYDNAVFITIFVTSLLLGRKHNGGSFKGYSALLYSKEGVHAERWGMPHCLINIGVYGLFILAVYDIVTVSGATVFKDLATSNAGFTGPTTGAIFAALSFACTAQSPINTWPIICGYALFSTCSLALGGGWTMAAQATLSSMAFATGLCPVVQRRGRIWGIVAGCIAAAICTFPVKLHGGLMIYNGGFTSGMVGIFMAVLFSFLDRMTREEDIESEG